MSRNTVFIARAAGTIAESVQRGLTPTDKQMFVLAATMQRASQEGDVAGVLLALELASTIRDELPQSSEWFKCHGQLTAIAAVAWLASRN